MRLTLAVLLVAVAGCPAPSEEPGPTDAGVTTVDAGVDDTCSGKICDATESCVTLQPGPPAVKMCLKTGDCTVKPPGRDVFGEALAAVGMTRCTATIPTDYLPVQVPAGVRNDAFRLPHFDALHHEPLRIPAWADGVANELTPIGPTSTSAAILAAAKHLGVTVSTERFVHDPTGAAPLVESFDAIAHEWGATIDVEAVSADAADVPVELQRRVANVLFALDFAAGVRAESFRPIVKIDEFFRCITNFILPMSKCGAFTPSRADVSSALLGGIDFGKLYGAAYQLATAVEDAGLESEAGLTGFAFDQKLPIGRVILSDAAAQTHLPGSPIALLVDTGGDDTYRVGAGATESSASGASLFIDLAGDDTYGYTEVPSPYDTGRLPSDSFGRQKPGDITKGVMAISLSEAPRQGAGVCGIGMLFDFAGNDRYKSLRMSQGYGALGVGVLADRKGDDLYEAEAGAQGSAAFGIGLLLDGAGNDTRKIHAFGQGFGYAKGFGALADGAGDDIAYSNPGDISEGGDPLYWSPQLPNGNGQSSFTQGAGFGRRDDTGQTAMSGGIGIYADFGNGKDAYTTSVFGQGAGYWFGTGILHDEGGDDHYDGKWYVRGSAAHFAMAVFRDKAGNDTHNRGNVSGKATSFGVGHDHSVAWMIDDSGNDDYNTPSLAVGAGNACGWGFFVDAAGNDKYDAHGLTLGRFGDPVGCSYIANATIGVLVDRGGDDTYLKDGAAVSLDNLTTVAEPDPKAPAAAAVQVDAATGDLLILP